MRTSRVFVALFLALSTTAAATTVVGVEPAAAATVVDNIRQVVSLTNVQRRAYGCPNLAANIPLMHAAQQHTSDMPAHNYFAHNSQNGKDPGSRITANGYRWTRWAENIAAGFPTAAKVVDGWMKSPGHRANILNGRFHEIGVGLVTGAPVPRVRGAGTYTTDFGG